MAKLSPSVESLEWVQCKYVGLPSRYSSPALITSGRTPGGKSGHLHALPRQVRREQGEGLGGGLPLVASILSLLPPSAQVRRAALRYGMACLEGRCKPMQDAMLARIRLT